MSKSTRLIFILLIILFSYHLIRDIFQIFELSNPIVDILHWPHQWCYPIGDYVTIPPEIFVIIGSFIVLKRDRFGKLGFLILISLIIWPIFIFLP